MHNGTLLIESMILTVFLYGIEHGEHVFYGCFFEYCVVGGAADGCVFLASKNGTVLCMGKPTGLP